MSLAGAAAGIAIVAMALFASASARPAFAAPILTAGSFASPPVAVGGSHFCALPGDGTVLCWGDNTFGQLGSGEVTDPTLPAGDVLVIHVVAADAASAPGDCVDLVSDGSVIKCHSTTSMAGATAITAGDTHTCALLADTTVRCWGSNAAVDGGQFAPSYSGGELGDGTKTVRSAPTTVVAGPGQTAALTGVASISAAAGYTCAVLLDHTARCWGSAPQQASPTPLMVLGAANTPLTNIASLTAGDHTACAVLLDGSVVCWGEGPLGNNQEQDGPQPGHWPVAVVLAGDLATPLGGVRSLALSHGVSLGPNGFAEGHSCALETLGEVDCWGVNDVSQLGNGSNSLTEPDATRNYAVPVIAASGSSDPLAGVVEIAAAGYFTCALMNDAIVRCWGLGIGGTSFEGGGAPIPENLANVVAIAAGGSGYCAVRDDGSLWCPSGAATGRSAVPGVTITGAAPGPTPAPSAAPNVRDTEGLVGNWAVTYGSASVVAISLANGTYSVTAVSPVQVIGGTCFLPVGTVLATFGGSGGTYIGQHGLWSTSTCAFGSWTPITATLSSDRQLAISYTSLPGTTTVLTAAPAQAEAVVGVWQEGIFAISFASGVYTATTRVPGTLGGGSCQIPAGTVRATFSGSGGSYAGQDLIWNPADCSTRSLPATFTLQGDSLTISHVPGAREIWKRFALPAAPQTSFRASVPSPWEINLSPAVLVETLAIVAGIIILIPFPGTLFNSTLEANYARVSRPIRLARRRVRSLIRRPSVEAQPGGDADRHDVWWTRKGVAFFIVLTVVVSGYLDPAFGPNAASIPTFVGMLIGLVVVLAAFDLPSARFYRKRSIRFWVRALPATAVVSVACVLISRLTDFHPGYLYGLIIATAAAQKLDTPAEGRLMAMGAISTIVVAVVAWFGLGIVSPLAAATPDPGPGLIIAQTVLSMIVAAGIELAAFGMLPFSFLTGASVKQWNWRVWLGLLVIGWFGFLIVILNPRNGYLSDTTRTPLVTIVGLLVFFSLGSVLFWWYFKRHPTVEEGAAVLSAKSH